MRSRDPLLSLTCRGAIILFSKMACSIFSLLVLVQFVRGNSTSTAVGMSKKTVDVMDGPCRSFVIGKPEKQEFYSPNYPHRYQNRTECVKILQAPPGNLLRLDFKDQFRIEDSQNCMFDYLEIRDGEYGYADLIGKYCGSTFPPTLTSSHRYLWLRFYSDENIEDTGFRAVYSVIPKPTSDTIRLHRGSTSSTAVTTSSEKTVSKRDVLQNSTEPCRSFVTANPEKRERYSQSYSQKYQNYTECMRTREGKLLRVSKSSTAIATAKRTVYKRNVADDIDGPCRSFTIGNPDKQEFYSPNYPQKYPNYTECITTLTAPPGNLLRLDFRDEFRIEDSPDCRYDYLEIRDGEYGYSGLIGKYCGSTFPPMLTSSDRYLWLRFYSDDNIEDTGFRAVYSMIPKPTSDVSPPEMKKCNKSVGGNEGFIDRNDIDEETVKMALTYSRPLDCMWVITVEVGWKIQLNFLKFSLDQPNDCESNFVDIFPERTDSQSRTHNFCGSIAVMVLSKSNILHVRFMAEPKAVNSTFLILYTAFREKKKDEACTDDEYDCEDMTCINISLKCNGNVNCRHRWDEADCKDNLSKLEQILEDEHMIIILIIFFLILTGMCFAFLFNCFRKLVKDHRIIKEHMRQSREGRLDQLGRKTASATVLTPLATIVPNMNRGDDSQTGSSVRSITPDKMPTGFSPATPQLKRDECYVPDAGDQILPIFIKTKRLHTDSSSTTNQNGDLIFMKGEHTEDNLTKDNPFESPFSMPEMKDCECQTRESLFHSINFSNSSADNSVSPSPPLPQITSKFAEKRLKQSNQKAAGMQTLPSRSGTNQSSFTTFGYGNKKILPKEHTFRAEAVIEMNKNKDKDGSASESRPFSIQSTKSAPDVIVTH